MKRKTEFREKRTLTVVAVMVVSLVFSLQVNFAGISYADVAIPGSGTAGNPYLISTADQLAQMAYNVNNGIGADAYYKMTADIDLAKYKIANAGEGWIPIGNAYSFSGDFDGGGYSIKNLYIIRPSSNYQGLFGHVGGGRISNLVLQSGAVMGAGNVGGLIGSIDSYCDINQVINKGVNVNGTSSYVGGLIGNVKGWESPSVTISANYATVSGQSYVGGIVGFGVDSTISRCMNSGRISTYTGEAGGLAGFCAGTITNSYSMGNVTSVDQYAHIGGLVGNASSCLLNNVYCSGTVSGVGDSAGIASLNGNVEISASNCIFIGSAIKGGDEVYRISPTVVGNNFARSDATYTNLTSKTTGTTTPNGANISPLSANEKSSWYGFGAYFSYTDVASFDSIWYVAPSGGLPVLRGFGGADDIGDQKIVVLSKIVPPPGKVSITKISTGKKKLTVQWKKVKGANGYEIQYRAKGTKAWKSSKPVSARSSKLTIKKLKKNKRYQVRVSAYKTSGVAKYFGKWSVVKTSKKIL